VSKPDYDIIHSPEAETFLRMVTKGFYNHSYIGLWLYEAIGREWDEMAFWAEEMAVEIHPQTCTWSIGIWEWVYGIETDESLTLECRRQKILAKIVGTRPVNPEAIRRGIASLAGMADEDVEIQDFSGPYRFGITLRPAGMPIPYADITNYIQSVKPAHLTAEVTADLGTAGHPLRHGGACLAEGEVSIGWDAPVHVQALRHGGVCMAEASADIGYEPSMYVFEVRDGHLLVSTDGPAGGPAGFRIDGRGHLMADTDIVPDAGMYRIREDGHLVYDTQG